MLSLLSDPKGLWYLNRASGLVLMVVSTLAILLGQHATRRRERSATPRFMWLELHRNLTLVGLMLLVLHVFTSVADEYVDISVLDAVVPFASPYRPFWLGLGTVALDLMVVILVTTALRHRISYRAWRIAHWTAYLVWPVSVVHGLGTGTDSLRGAGLSLTIGCLAAVLASTAPRIAAAVRERLAVSSPGPDARRPAAPAPARTSVLPRGRRWPA
jgi:predicted ferric reductase